MTTGLYKGSGQTCDINADGDRVLNRAQVARGLMKRVFCSEYCMDGWKERVGVCTI